MYHIMQQQQRQQPGSPVGQTANNISQNNQTFGLPSNANIMTTAGFPMTTGGYPASPYEYHRQQQQANLFAAFNPASFEQQRQMLANFEHQAMQQRQMGTQPVIPGLNLPGYNPQQQPQQPQRYGSPASTGTNPSSPATSSKSEKGEGGETNKRRRFTEEEDDMLHLGIIKYGFGRWTILLADPELQFHHTRTRDILRMRANSKQFMSKYNIDKNYRK